MTGKSHIVTGLMSGFAMLLFVPELDPVYFLVAMFGALVPDLDASESTIKHLRILKMKLFYPLATITGMIFKHRGILHSVFGLMLCTSLIYLLFGTMGFDLYREMTLAFAMGYASHLFADSYTISGIMPLYPLTKAKVGLRKLRTGNVGEQIVVMFFWMVIAFGFGYVLMEGRMSLEDVDWRVAILMTLLIIGG